MRLIDVHKQLNTQDKCLDYLETMRWPNGLACIACGSDKVSRITRKAGKNRQTRIYQCLETECKHQFSATAGTIFHDSHLPLDKWFMAIALLCEAKKGISANQLKRHLGVNYRTAWHLAHRIREAMKDGGEILTGTVEADETYIGAKVKRKGQPRPKRTQKDVVLGMVERGGRLRLLPIADNKRTIIEPVLVQNIDPAATLQTDQAAVYEIMAERKVFPVHRRINHRRSYGQGINHSNTIENAFSLFKRGLIGSYHKVSIKHLGRYCDEFSYRFNRRDQQAAMFGETMRHLLRGKALPYKKLTASVAHQ